MTLSLPKLPYVPIDLTPGDRMDLGSLENRMEKILVVGKEKCLGAREKVGFYVFGCRGDHSLYYSEEHLSLNGWASEYVTLVKDGVNRKIMEESSFKDPHTTRTNLNGFLSFVTLGAYYFYLSRYVEGPLEDKKREFVRKINYHVHRNFEQITRKIDPIKLYQGGQQEVERMVKKPVEVVETSRPETFLQAQNSFWLRVQAYLAGADAVIHYQPGSSLGTPVRFKK